MASSCSSKRTSKSPEVGQQRARLYAYCLDKQFGRCPVIFYTNVYEHRIWDDAGATHPARWASAPATCWSCSSSVAS